MVVLRLSVVPRGRAIGLLPRRVPPPDCSGQGEGQSFFASCAIAAALSFQTCFACVHMYSLYARVYICVCVYIYVYVHLCMYMYMCAFMHMCMCLCMHICA